MILFFKICLRFLFYHYNNILINFFMSDIFCIFIKCPLITDSLLSQTSELNKNFLYLEKNPNYIQNILYSIDIDNFMSKEKQTKKEFISKLYTFIGRFIFQKLSNFNKYSNLNLEFIFFYKNKKKFKIMFRIKKNKIYCNRNIRKINECFSNETFEEPKNQKENIVIDIIENNSYNFDTPINFFNDISLFECLDNTLL